MSRDMNSHVSLPVIHRIFCISGLSLEADVDQDGDDKGSDEEERNAHCKPDHQLVVRGCNGKKRKTSSG